MANPRLTSVVWPAENMRGCRLATDFRDAATMLRDGWTSFGSPTYYKGGGIILNGTTQYLTRPLAGETVATALVFQIEFTPSFALDDGLVHYFYDTTGTRIAAYKDATNGFTIRPVNFSFQANYATISPLWVAGGRNLLTVYLASGVNVVWFNGSQIATNSTVWTPVSLAELYIGRYNAGASGYFAGTIHKFSIGQHTGTLAEHTAYYNNSMFSWRNTLTCDLFFGTAQYDPTAKKTLDVSGHDNHATLGDGAGTGEPTQGRGFLTLDGVNDYLSGIANPAGSYTVLGYEDTGTGWTFFSNNDLTKWTPIMTSGGFTGKLGHLAVAPSVLNATQLLDAAWQFRQFGGEV